MDRTYQPDLLPTFNPLDLTWARNWVRFLLHDVPHRDQPDETGWPDFSKSDVELNAALMLDSVGPSRTVRYFRPHVTAARLYLGDPNLWKTRSVNGTAETKRDAEQITAAWLAQGKAIDALIPDELLPVTAEKARVRYGNGIPLDIRGI